MNQEYEEYSEENGSNFRPLSRQRRGVEALAILIALSAIYLLLALVTFHPADPSWSQTTLHQPVHNAGGAIGAWLADALLLIFGIVAYAIPLILLVVCWRALRQHVHDHGGDYGLVAVKLTGLVLLIIATCGLADASADDIWYFTSGGVVGNLVNNAMFPWFSAPGATLTLLSIWAASFTLFTGWSWLAIAETLGRVVVQGWVYLCNRCRRDKMQTTDPGSDAYTSAMLLSPAPSEEAALAQFAVATTVSSPMEEQHDGGTTNTLAVQQVHQEDSTSSVEAAVIAPDSVTTTADLTAKTPDSATENALPLANAQSAPPLRFTVLAPISAEKDHTLSGSNGTKPHMQPSMPRPNPVRIPTRRELAAQTLRSAAEQGRASPSAESPGVVEQPPAMNESTPPVPDSSAMQWQRPAASTLQQSTNDSSPPMVHDAVTVAVDSTCATPQEATYSQDSTSLLASPTLSRPEADTPVSASAGEMTTRRPQSASPGSDLTDTGNALSGLIHPFLMRHEQPLVRPTTPLPTLDLLTQPQETAHPIDSFELEKTSRLLESRLADYRVKAAVVAVSPGPVITRYELELAPGVKAARISGLARDLARSLSTVAVRVVEVIPGRPYVGLELPNKHRQTVYLRDVIDSVTFRESKSPLSIVLGKDISAQSVVADLAKMPHLLVAGTTGSGKSVGVNAMILSMLYKATPQEVRFIMIDPKMLELSVYEGIPHLLTEVVTDMKDAANALRWSVGEMERRYKLMSALGVRNLAGYNDKVAQADAMGRPIPDPFWKSGESMLDTPPVLEKLPFIVVIVDEFADLMMAAGKKIEELIARLAQKARAAGIHLILATQRPSVDVITGLIKANIPTRIAFTVSSKIDSRTILDQSGAESLLGMGDMLYMAPNSSIPVRVHGAFVRDQEVHAVVQNWKARGRPHYIDSITADGDSEGDSYSDEELQALDPLFDRAVAFVVEKRRASISGVQRQFRIGYNRAARIIEQMEAQNIVSPPGHNGNREVLAPPASGGY